MLMLTFSIAAFSQDNKQHHKTPEEKAQAMTDKMKAEFNLTDDQVQKVQAANADFITKTWDLKKDGAANTQEAKDKIKPFKDEYHTTLRGILTPEQFTKFEAWKDEKEDKMKRKDKQ